MLPLSTLYIYREANYEDLDVKRYQCVFTVAISESSRSNIHACIRGKMQTCARAFVYLCMPACLSVIQPAFVDGLAFDGVYMSMRVCLCVYNYAFVPRLSHTPWNYIC